MSNAEYPPDELPAGADAIPFPPPWDRESQTAGKPEPLGVGVRGITSQLIQLQERRPRPGSLSEVEVPVDRPTEPEADQEHFDLLMAAVADDAGAHNRINRLEQLARERHPLDADERYTPDLPQ